MPHATEHRQAVFKDGSATCMARVVGAAAEPITRSMLTSARYTVSLIDPQDEDADTPIEHHEAETLTISEVVFDALQVDDLWTADEGGYNFKHVIDVLTYQAFAIAGREYRVTYALTPTIGQVIIVRFRLKVI